MFLSTKTNLALLTFFLTSCAGTPPLREYVLARSALKYAKYYEAKKHSADIYRQAVSFYREAQSHFNNRYYGSAEEAFEESRAFAERAEEISRWKKYEKGDFGL